ncbi:MAG: repeat-containing protein, partial [Chthonomonadales bacterium]|nr:repeat-containing protein [Chthonomonadales bacterium]
CQRRSRADSAGTAYYTYDNGGLETAITNPNGTTVANVYDHAGRLTSVTNKNSGGTTLSSFSYTLDTDGRKTAVSEADGSAVSFGYDWGGRLTSETRTGTNPYSISYTVDAVGNRTSQTIGSATTAFTLNSDDELTATSSSTGGFVNSYSYNANGEQTGRTLSGTAYTLAYDYDGQLLSTSVGGSTQSSFAYDATGRRVSRTNGGNTTKFCYAGGQILAEKQGSTTTAVYTYGNSLIRKDSEYPLFDGGGHERTVTNGSQTVTGTINFDGFGNTVGSTGSSASPYMYGATSGYRTEGDAGLSHVGARYYDAQVGRFITRDTELDQKPYLYCEHDPVNATDPSGHLPGWGRVIVAAGALIGIPVMIYEIYDGWRISQEKNKHLKKVIKGGGHEGYNGDGSIIGNPERGGPSGGKEPPWSADAFENPNAPKHRDP